MEELIRATAALIFVLSIIFGMGWAARRYSNSRANVINNKSDLRIVEWRGMDARRKLAVVHWDGREHLLCLSQTDQCVVASRDAPAPQPQDTEPSSAAQSPPKNLVQQISEALPKFPAQSKAEKS